MKKKRLALARDGGWTFIEATISIVIMSIMVLGLTVVLMAFREHLDKSWAIRVMDQYGNDIVERMSHEMRNAVNIDVRNGTGNTHKVSLEFLDPLQTDVTYVNEWRADIRSARVLVNNRVVDPTFPPSQLGRGEFFEIVQFTMTPYGILTSNASERVDRFQRNEDFMSATWDLRFILRYNRNAIETGQQNWSYQKEYYNRVYMRNMNLTVPVE